MLYSVAMFVHVLGALLLFATLSLEGVALRQIRRSTTAEQVRDTAGIAGLTRLTGPLSAVGVLVAGLYMTATTWGPAPWILVGLFAWLFIGVLGAVNGIRLAAIGRAAAGNGRLSPDLAARARNPLLAASWVLRVAIVLGVVFLMIFKPGVVGALVTVVVAAAIGAGAGLPAWRPAALQKKEVLE